VAETALTVAPIFLIIVLGAVLRRSGFPGDAFWPAAERLTYFVLFPALLLASLARAKIGGLPVGGMAAVIVLAALAMTALLIALRRPLGLDGPAFTSLFQGAIRFNTYLGVATTAAVLGEDGITLAAVYLAAMVPLGNVLCVAALSAFTGESGVRPWAMAGAIARNPLILACLAGLAIGLWGGGLPGWADLFLSFLGRAALPVGLLCIGAGLDLGATHAARGTIALSCLLKLAVMPAITAGAALALGLDGPAASVVILFNALPAAPAAYVLARQLGGDARLMAGILTAQIAASAVTLPVLLEWMA